MSPAERSSRTYVHRRPVLVLPFPGANTGTGVSASALPGFDPTVLGTLGVVLGSIVAGALGRYVAFPLWAALFSSDKR